MKLLIVIPCYNHNKYLYSLIDEISNLYDLDILCIDDGSDIPLKVDNTKYHLLCNKINRGKGHSILKASKYAISHQYTHILVMDADLQHDPKDISKFININENYDIVYGNRNFLHTMPIHRLMSNFITSLIISIICKKNIKDSQCGYRRYKINLFEKEYYENGYQFETEILLKNIKKNSLIIDIPIKTIYNNNESNMNYIVDTFKFIKLIFKQIF